MACPLCGERIVARAGGEPAGGGAYVLHWMRQAQRAHGNHALAVAADAADRLGLPLLTVFALAQSFPEAEERHFAFMLQGLAETAAALVEAGVGFACPAGEPPTVVARMAERAKDRRPRLYPAEALEAGDTADPYWNAAQRQLLRTGGMPNLMRMYWGKKIIEWTPTPEEALDIMLRLNNRYQLDGRDPNSFAGVAWCFGRHDRPWPPRPVLGCVRHMTAAGLDRKFDMDAYLRAAAEADP